MYIYAWETSWEHGVVIADDEIDARGKLSVTVTDMENLDLTYLGRCSEGVFPIYIF